jgi:hypothetical protein
MTGAQFQASIDRMLGSVGRTFGKPICGLPHHRGIVW